MRHVRILGACLVAVLALGVVVATSASAAGPEWGRCVSIGKKGKYSDANCTVEDVSKGKPKGTYEWEAGAETKCYGMKKGKYSDPGCTVLDEKKGKPKGSYEKTTGGPKFTGSGGAGTLSTVLLQCAQPGEEPYRTGTRTGEECYNEFHATVECTSEAATGEAVGTDGVKNVSVSFKGCVALEVLKCSNTANPEEIQINTVKGSLGYIKKSTHDVGVLLEPETPGANFVEFECGAPNGIGFTVGQAQPEESSRYGAKAKEIVVPGYSRAAVATASSRRSLR